MEFTLALITCIVALSSLIGVLCDENANALERSKEYRLRKTRIIGYGSGTLFNWSRSGLGYGGYWGNERGSGSGRGFNGIPPRYDKRSFFHSEVLTNYKNYYTHADADQTVMYIQVPIFFLPTKR